MSCTSGFSYEIEYVSYCDSQFIASQIMRAFRIPQSTVKNDKVVLCKKQIDPMSVNYGVKRRSLVINVITPWQVFAGMNKCSYYLCLSSRIRSIVLK